MTVTVEQMANHIDGLLVRYRIGKREQVRGGRAHKRGRFVSIPPVRSVVTYATALHEIGHIIGKGRSGGRLDREAAAWAWALRNALAGSVTDRFAEDVRRSLRSYLDWVCLRNPAWTIQTTVDGRTVVDTAGRPCRIGAPDLPTVDLFWHLLDYGRLP